VALYNLFYNSFIIMMVGGDTNHGVVGTPTMASLGHQPSYFNQDATPMALVFGVIFATLV
jgi:hypothetical protein